MRRLPPFACVMVLPAIAAAEPLKIEPGAGSLSSGSVVYVDDGKCPAGQVKKVIGGSTSQSISRSRSCISVGAMRAEETAANAGRK